MCQEPPFQYTFIYHLERISDREFAYLEIDADIIDIGSSSISLTVQSRQISGAYLGAKMTANRRHFAELQPNTQIACVYHFGQDAGYDGNLNLKSNFVLIGNIIGMSYSFEPFSTSVPSALDAVTKVQRLRIRDEAVLYFEGVVRHISFDEIRSDIDESPPDFIVETSRNDPLFKALRHLLAILHTLRRHRNVYLLFLDGLDADFDCPREPAAVQELVFLEL